jgi:DNA-binding winged helix-turn-helix (wHTH) protein/tetratricopeptide (TPR) repeat protein
MVQVAPDRPIPARFTFAGFILDTGTRCLTRGGEPVPLSPKEFHTLLILVQEGGHAVPRETLIQTIWPDTVVGDTSLGRIISVLRRHLGAEAIVSVARFGYRFALDIVPLDSSIAATIVPEPAVATPPASPQHRRHFYTFAALFLAALLVAAGFITLAKHQTRRPLAESDAARWDSLGLFALREGTYFKASKAFEQAIQLAPRNPLLHAHLADAWLQLNMDEAARQELLLASNHDAVQQLSDDDRRYIEAVRATAVRDYPAATRQYQTILESSQVQDRSNALEDLGRALQREGRLPEATSTYRHAAELQPTNAGVQLRLGLLAGLQRDLTVANRYLDHATSLYEASTNQEGEAEVDYQRASMAYVRADYTRAAMFYSDSLDLATKLNDLQMEARALGGLSTVRRWQGDLPGSAEAANRVMVLARILHSDFWQVEGVMHLANIAIVRKDIPESRRLLTEALELADRVKQPRLQTNAEFSMGDLADQTGDYTQELAMAQRARQHYESYGSADGVADASMQVIQAERGLHNYPAALHDAQALLDDSIRTGSDLFAEDSEAELGHIYTALEDHAAALDHYQRALDLAHKTGSQVSLKSLHVVSALAQLGRRQQA